MLWVTALPRLGREARSRQLDVKGCVSSRGVVWGFCIVVVHFSSGCDALCFQGEGYVEVNTWEGKEEKRSHCPGTTEQVLTHLLFPRGKIDKSHTFGDGWSHSRTRTAALCARACKSTMMHLCDGLPGDTFPGQVCGSVPGWASTPPGMHSGAKKPTARPA